MKKNYETKGQITFKDSEVYCPERVYCFILPLFKSLSINTSALLVLSKNFFQIIKVNGLELPLVVQWLRICLLMQGMWVQSLVWEDPTCHRQLSPCATATEPVHLEPGLLSKRSHCNEKPAHDKERRPTHCS